MTEFNAFAEASWRSDGVERLSLELQRQYQLEPNLLLLALWQQQQQRFLTAEQFADLTAATHHWCDTVLKPYRRIRSLAKGTLAEDEYRKMLQVELALERRSQQLLVYALDKHQCQTEGDNLTAVLASAALSLEQLDGEQQMLLLHLFECRL